MSGIASGRPPRTAWRARARARITYLEAELEHESVRREADDRMALIEGMRGHLEKARSAADEDFGWRWLWSGSAAREGVCSNIRSAEVLLIQLVSDEEAAGRASEVMALVKDHLDADDPRRVRLALRLRPIISGDITGSDRDLMARALDAAYCSLDDELARVRSLRNILWAATVLVLAGVVSLALYGWFSPSSLSLCFSPGNSSRGEVDVVCPTAEHHIRQAEGAPRIDPSSRADPTDILTVEIAGLAGAALTVIASLRRIRGTDSPYMLPLASAVLKFPTGALSAFLGLLLIRGAFVPGLSDLDSRAQVLAWAAAFGAAQHLVTRLVDDRAQMTLSEVGRTTDAVVDPERVAVREGAAVPAAAGSPDGAGPRDERHEGPHGTGGDGEPAPDGAPAHRRSGA
ncbi:hypothetical protein [Streptomyces hawaiiensis]|jgi:hypothetical protein|uniref:Uncharacterized protein n=1 Tax=Streptomyces hawaiiensis TaxID=67305 RepID=A0A6G5RMS8_9ACTN|nr:hypothetical protein CEB94_35210 [Streptomyces hawaiiensis]